MSNGEVWLFPGSEEERGCHSNSRTKGEEEITPAPELEEER